MNEQYTFIDRVGVTWYLNGKEVTLIKGGLSRIYYFTKAPRPETACGLPDGFSVLYTKKSRLPVLTNKQPINA